MSPRLFLLPYSSPVGPCTSVFPAFPAYFRGLEPKIDDFRRCTPCILRIPIEKVNPAYPELVLKGFVALFQ